MSSTYLQKVGTKLFRAHVEQYTPQDPLYEYYTDSRGKQRRRKRQIPPGISERDAKILKKVQRRAHYLDKSFNICGFRFGWTFILGIIPAVGDAACAGLNYYLVLRKAREADLPPWLLGQMFFNNAVSAFGGLVPIVGDIVIAVYKANSRNAILLEEFLRLRGEEILKSQAENAQTDGEGSGSGSNSASRTERLKSGQSGKESQSRRSFGSLFSRKEKSPATPSNGNRGNTDKN